MQKIRTIGSALVLFLFLWGAGAQIAPKVFVVESDRNVMIEWLVWLWNPAMIWIALFLAAAWFAWLLRTHDADIADIKKREDVSRNFESQLYKLETRVNDTINNTGSGITVNLQTSHEQLNAKIDRLRVYSKLDQFVKRADGLKQRIRAERSRRGIRSLTESITGLAAQVPHLPDFEVTLFSSEVAALNNEVYEFLRKEAQRHAPEFHRAVPSPTETMEPIGLLLHNIEVIEGRILEIKDKVPV